MDPSLGLKMNREEIGKSLKDSYERIEKVIGKVSAHCNKVQTISVQLYDFLDNFMRLKDSTDVSEREKKKSESFEKACSAFFDFCESLTLENWLKQFIQYDINFAYRSLEKMWDAWQCCSEEFKIPCFDFKESLLYSHCEDLISIHKQLSPHIADLPKRFRKIVVEKLKQIEKLLSYIPQNDKIGSNDKILKHTMWITIKENIGVGGYAAVHLAKMKSTGQLVAVKELKNVQLGRRNVLYMKREIDALIHLNHPNVVKLVGVTITPPFCFVTDYLPNGCLVDMIHGKTPSPRLTPLFRSKIALDTARAMEYIHKLGYVHRDFKSPNILLDENDRGVVCDFGLTRKTGRRMSCELGTMQWCAPELLVMDTPYNQNVDVYAYGITLWELLTFQMPYKSYRQIQFCNMVLRYGMRPEIADDTPKELADLITECWSQDKKKRPTFKQVREIIETGKCCFPGTDVDEFMEYVNKTKEEHERIMLESGESSSVPEKQLEKLKVNGPYTPEASEQLESVINNELLTDDIIDIVIKMYDNEESRELSKRAIEIIADDEKSSIENLESTVPKLFNKDPEFTIQIIKKISPRITDKVEFLKNFFDNHIKDQTPHVFDLITAMNSVSVAQFAFENLNSKYHMLLYRYFYKQYGPCQEVINAGLTTFGTLKYLIASLTFESKLNLINGTTEENIQKCTEIMQNPSWKEDEESVAAVLSCYGSLIKDSWPGKASCDILKACSLHSNLVEKIVTDGYLDVLCDFILSHREVVVNETTDILKTLYRDHFNLITEDKQQNIFNNYVQCFARRRNERAFSFIINILTTTNNSFNITLLIESLLSMCRNIGNKSLAFIKAMLTVNFETHTILLNDGMAAVIDKILEDCDQNIAYAIGILINKCLACNKEEVKYSPIIRPILRYLYNKKPTFQVADVYLKVIQGCIKESKDSDEGNEVIGILLGNSFIKYLNKIPLLYQNESRIPELITCFVNLFSTTK